MWSNGFKTLQTPAPLSLPQLSRPRACVYDSSSIISHPSNIAGYASRHDAATKRPYQSFARCENQALFQSAPPFSSTQCTVTYQNKARQAMLPANRHRRKHAIPSPKTPMVHSQKKERTKIISRLLPGRPPKPTPSPSQVSYSTGRNSLNTKSQHPPFSSSIPFRQQREGNIPGNCPCFPCNRPIHHSLSFAVLVTISITSPARKLRSPSACAE